MLSAHGRDEFSVVFQWWWADHSSMGPWMRMF